MFSFLTRFKENDEIAEENEKMRKGKKAVEKELEAVEKERDDYKDKYIKILEEKGEGFNQFLKYLGLYEEYYNLAKENKKEIADLKSDARRTANIIEEKDVELQNKTDFIAKLERKIKRIEKKVEEDKDETTEIYKTKCNEASEVDRKAE